MILNKDEIKYRHEFKYLVSDAQIDLLKHRLKGIVYPDPHTDESGRYIIRSLYFDDYRNRCFYDNENGNDPRAKYRIRTYNNSTSHISLEKKIKQKGKTLKLSCPLTIAQTEALIQGHYLTDIANHQKLLQEISAEIMVNQMKPVVIVEYERYPYIYRYGNVRVTLDTCISSSNDINRFFETNITKRPVLPAGYQLLEVKYDEYLPYTIYRTLQLGDLQQTAFSKFYLCRKHYL